MDNNHDKQIKCWICYQKKNADEFAPSRANHKLESGRICKICVYETESKKRQKRKGVIYIITNPAWEGYCKIGISTIDAKRRLDGFNTSSPFRDFELHHTFISNDVFHDEREVHGLLIHKRSINTGEWFKITVEESFEIIKKWHTSKYINHKELK